MLSDEQLREIERRARTLSECLEAGRAAGPPLPGTISDPSRVAARVERWRQMLAPEGAAAFDRRLRAQGVDPDRLVSLLDHREVIPIEDLPSWTEALREGVAAANATDTTSDATADRDHAPYDPQARLPFEELFEPFLRVARARLAGRSGARVEVADGARRAFERGLLCWLSFTAAPALELEFSCFRATRRTGLARLVTPSDGSTTDYRAFLESLRGRGLADFLIEYAALARLLGTLVEQWVETLGELLDRLAEDAEAIREVFGIDGELGPIVGVDGSIADRHHGGRSVFVLELGCGLVLVYKPRSLAIDRAWFDLLQWCQDRGFWPSCRTLRVVERPGYGWIEFAAAEAPVDHRAARRFFHRAGHQLALLHVLQATDLHFENLIVCGDQPVLIDVETLFHPRLPGDVGDERARTAHDLAQALIEASVLRTGLLPRWQPGDGTRSIDLTGLGGGKMAQQTAVPSRQWSDLNTDAMRLRWAGARVDAPDGAAWMAELAEGAVEAVVAGFREAARCLLAHRPRLVSENGPLAAFRDVRSRVLLRPTQVYASLQARTLDPRCLRHGIDRSLEFDGLRRASDHDRLRAAAAPLLAAEKRALERLDIPLVEASPAATTVHVDGCRGAADLFDHSGFDRALDALRALDPERVEQQVEIIRGAFAARRDEPRRRADRRRGSLTSLEVPRSAADRCLDGAAAIARRLVERAIVGVDGDITWIAPRVVAAAGHHQLDPLAHGLYDGLAGVALFLAAAAAETGDGAFAEQARGAIDASWQRWRVAREASAAGPDIGGASGLGGLLYATVRVGGWLDDAAWIERAARAAMALDVEQPDAERLADEHATDERGHDVLSGTAGAVLGLLAVDQERGNSELLERAIACGRRLVDQRTVTASGRVWSSVDGSPRLGFSHGASGIAYALLRLARASGEVIFVDAAREALTWERSLYDPQAGRWPDRRQRSVHDPEVTAGSWCHGAAGIGLARLGGLDVVDDPSIREEIEWALAAVRRHDSGAVDQLCCGLAGRCELLLVAGLRFDRPALIAEAQRMLLQALDAAEGLAFGTRPAGCFHPGLYQGVAGIGYQLLRLRAPERVPSILLWR